MVDDGDSSVVSDTAYTLTNNNDGTWSFEWVTAEGNAGSYTATVTAEDGNNDPVATPFSITIEPFNAAPQIAAIDPVTVEETETATASITATDAEDDNLTLSIEVVNDGDSSVVSDTAYTLTNNNDGTWSFEWVTAEGNAGSYIATVTAEDGNNDPVITTFSITVEALNESPQIAAIDPITIEETMTATASITATDAEDDNLTLSIEVVDDGDSSVVSDTAYTFTNNGNGTASFEWVTAVGNAGSYTATVTAEDGNNDPVTTTFAITVVLQSPDMVQYTPSDGEYGVVRNTNIVVEFSEMVELNDGIFLLTYEGNPNPPTQIPLDDPQVSMNGNEIIINPSVDLLGGAVYTVTWRPGDPNSDLFDVSWSFTTRPDIDMDNDGFIAPSDIAYVLNRIGQTGLDAMLADVNGDGVVNDTDLQAVSDQLGETYP